MNLKVSDLNKYLPPGSFANLGKDWTFRLFSPTRLIQTGSLEGRITKWVRTIAQSTPSEQEIAGVAIRSIEQSQIRLSPEEQGIFNAFRNHALPPSVQPIFPLSQLDVPLPPCEGNPLLALKASLGLFSLLKPCETLAALITQMGDLLRSEELADPLEIGQRVERAQTKEELFQIAQKVTQDLADLPLNQTKKVMVQTQGKLPFRSFIAPLQNESADFAQIIAQEIQGLQIGNAVSSFGEFRQRFSPFLFESLTKEKSLLMKICLAPLESIRFEIQSELEKQFDLFQKEISPWIESLLSKEEYESLILALQNDEIDRWAENFSKRSISFLQEQCVEKLLPSFLEIHAKIPRWVQKLVETKQELSLGEPPTFFWLDLTKQSNGNFSISLSATGTAIGLQTAPCTVYKNVDAAIFNEEFFFALFSKPSSVDSFYQLLSDYFQCKPTPIQGLSWISQMNPWEVSGPWGLICHCLDREIENPSSFLLHLQSRFLCQAYQAGESTELLFLAQQLLPKAKELQDLSVEQTIEHLLFECQASSPPLPSNPLAHLDKPTLESIGDFLEGVFGSEIKGFIDFLLTHIPEKPPLSPQEKIVQGLGSVLYILFGIKPTDFLFPSKMSFFRLSILVGKIGLSLLFPMRKALLFAGTSFFQLGWLIIFSLLESLFPQSIASLRKEMRKWTGQAASSLIPDDLRRWVLAKIPYIYGEISRKAPLRFDIPIDLNRLAPRSTSFAIEKIVSLPPPRSGRTTGYKELPPIEKRIDPRSLESTFIRWLHLKSDPQFPSWLIEQLEALPLPNEDPFFWEQVSPDQSTHLIQLILNMVRPIKNPYEVNYPLQITMFKLYAMADHLARKDPANRLDGFFVSGWELIWWHGDSLFQLPHPRWRDTLDRLKQYFRVPLNEGWIEEKASIQQGSNQPGALFVSHLFPPEAFRSQLTRIPLAYGSQFIFSPIRGNPSNLERYIHQFIDPSLPIKQRIDLLSRLEGLPEGFQVLFKIHQALQENFFLDTLDIDSILGIPIYTSPYIPPKKMSVGDHLIPKPENVILQTPPPSDIQRTFEQRIQQVRFDSSGSLPRLFDLYHEGRIHREFLAEFLNYLFQFETLYPYLQEHPSFIAEIGFFFKKALDTNPGDFGELLSFGIKIQGLCQSIDKEMTRQHFPPFSSILKKKRQERDLPAWFDLQRSCWTLLEDPEELSSSQIAEATRDLLIHKTYRYPEAPHSPLHWKWVPVVKEGLSNPSVRNPLLTQMAMDANLWSKEKGGISWEGEFPTYWGGGLVFNLLAPISQQLMIDSNQIEERIQAAVLQRFHIHATPIQREDGFYLPEINAFAAIDSDRIYFFKKMDGKTFYLTQGNEFIWIERAKEGTRIKTDAKGSRLSLETGWVDWKSKTFTPGTVGPEQPLLIPEEALLPLSPLSWFAPLNQIKAYADRTTGNIDCFKLFDLEFQIKEGKAWGTKDLAGLHISPCQEFPLPSKELPLLTQYLLLQDAQGKYVLLIRMENLLGTIADRLFHPRSPFIKKHLMQLSEIVKTKPYLRAFLDEEGNLQSEDPETLLYLFLLFLMNNEKKRARQLLLDLVSKGKKVPFSPDFSFALSCLKLGALFKNDSFLIRSICKLSVITDENLSIHRKEKKSPYPILDWIGSQMLFEKYMESASGYPHLPLSVEEEAFFLHKTIEEGKKSLSLPSQIPARLFLFPSLAERLTAVEQTLGEGYGGILANIAQSFLLPKGTSGPQSFHLNSPIETLLPSMALIDSSPLEFRKIRCPQESWSPLPPSQWDEEHLLASTPYYLDFLYNGSSATRKAFCRNLILLKSRSDLSSSVLDWLSIFEIVAQSPRRMPFNPREWIRALENQPCCTSYETQLTQMRPSLTSSLCQIGLNLAQESLLSVLNPQSMLLDMASWLMPPVSFARKAIRWGQTAVTVGTTIQAVHQQKNTLIKEPERRIEEFLNSSDFSSIPPLEILEQELMDSAIEEREKDPLYLVEALHAFGRMSASWFEQNAKRPVEQMHRLIGKYLWALCEKNKEKSLKNLQNEINKQTNPQSKEIFSLEWTKEKERKRAYRVGDPFWRLLLLFEGVNGLLLWESQVEKFSSLLLNPEKRKVLQLPTGAGKTSFGLPFLGRVTGPTCLIFPTPLVGAQIGPIQSKGEQTFGQGGNRLQIDRNTPMTEEFLLALLHRIQRVANEGETLGGSKLDFQALELLFIDLLEKKGSPQPIALLQKILSTLQTLPAIVDEAHELFQRKKELNYPSGNKKFLPEPLLHELLLTVLSYLDGGGLLQTEGLSPEEIEGSLDALSRKIAKESRWNLSLDQQEEFALYLRRKTKTLPPWVSSHVEKETIGLLVGLLSELLPEALGKKLFFDYGFSNQSKTSYAVPYAGHNLPIENACFKNPIEAALKTVFSILLQGLSKNQARHFVSDLIYNAKKEQLNTHIPFSKTYAAQSFFRWTQTHLSTESEAVDLTNVINRSPRALCSYAKRFILRKIFYFAHNVSSTSQNFASMFDSFYGDTATPSNHATFPLGTSLIEDPDNSDLFIEALQSSPLNILQIEKKSPLESVLTQAFHHPNAFALIDAGATLLGLSNLTVARSILQFAQQHRPGIRAVLFFLPDGEEMILESPEKEPTPASQISIPPEERITYYDQVHTFGTDVKQPFEAIGVVTLSPTTTFEQWIQAGGRMRGIRNLNQTLQTAVLAPMPLGLEEIIAQTQANEERIKPEENYRAAIQMLDDLARRLALDALLKSPDPIPLFADFRDLLIKSHPSSLFELYGYPPELIASQEALIRHATSLERTLRPLLDNSNARQKWEEAVRQIARQSHYPLTVSQTSHDLQGCQQVDLNQEQEQEQQTQVEQQQQMNQNLSAPPWVELRKMAAHWPPFNPFETLDWLFRSPSSRNKSIVEIIPTKQLDRRFGNRTFWTSNAIGITKQNGLDLPLETRRKTLFEIVVIASENTFYSMAIDQADGIFWRAQLKANRELSEETYPLRIALFDLSLQTVLESGKKRISTEELLESRPFCFDLLRWKAIAGQPNFRLGKNQAHDDFLEKLAQIWHQSDPTIAFLLQASTEQTGVNLQISDWKPILFPSRDYY